VNELGDIGLDQLVVAQAADNVMLLDAGCLCCVNSGALHETLIDLTARRARGEIPAFERVIVETSGAADPAPLLNVVLGHPLVRTDYRLAAVVCAVDAQHFLSSRTNHPELDKQVAMADRIVITKQDLADPAPVKEFLRDVDIVERPFVGEARPHVRPHYHGPLLRHGEPGGIRAYALRPGAMTWASWARWSRLVAERFGARLLRVKGLLRMEDTGEIVMVHGVQGVFHNPQRFRDWPDADRANRLVCIARDVERDEIEETLKDSETRT
jgi:G3E family GTPase